MGKNILIVSSNKEMRKDLSKLLARDTKMLNIDADELLDFELLNTQRVSIKEVGNLLKDVEREYVNRVANFKNCIITMSDKMFLADDHFKLLKDLNKIYIQVAPKKVGKNAKKEEVYRAEQELLMYNEIDGLLSSLCDITIKADDKLSKLSQNIIYRLNNK